jgi:SET domain-containing protein
MKNIITFEKYSNIKILIDDEKYMEIDIDDVLLVGRFKNKKLKVNKIELNDKNDVVINNKPILKFRKFS